MGGVVGGGVAAQGAAAGMFGMMMRLQNAGEAWAEGHGLRGERVASAECTRACVQHARGAPINVWGEDGALGLRAVACICGVAPVAEHHIYCRCGCPGSIDPTECVRVAAECGQRMRGRRDCHLPPARELSRGHRAREEGRGRAFFVYSSTGLASRIGDRSGCCGRGWPLDEIWQPYHMRAVRVRGCSDVTLEGGQRT